LIIQAARLWFVGPDLQIHQCGLPKENGAGIVQAVVMNAWLMTPRKQHQERKADGCKGAPGSTGTSWKK
jgi:DNA-directed RNA polymerase beta' subunit